MPRKYKLNALDTFTCIGSDCPDSCCKRNWDIDVDKSTYNKWLGKNDNEPYKKIFLEHTITKQKDNKNINVLAKDNNNNCFHLNQHDLCSIQDQFGENMMPSTCREYPRIQHSVKNVNIQSAVLSCPEIVRLVLFSDNEPVYKSDGSYPSPQKKNITTEKIHWFLDKISQNVFSEENFSLNIKLTYLARVLAEMAISGKNGTLNDDMLKSFSHDHALHMTGLRDAVQSNEFGPQPANSRYMWHVIINELTKNSDFNKKLGIHESIEELLALHRSSEGTSGEEDPFNKKIQEYKQLSKEKLHPYKDAFTRYMQAVLISKCFPWKSGGHGYLDAFLLCTLPFATVQILSWLLINKNKEISQEELISIINGVESRLSHNSEIMKYVSKNKSFYQLERYFDWFLDIA